LQAPLLVMSRTRNEGHARAKIWMQEPLMARELNHGVTLFLQQRQWMYSYPPCFHLSVIFFPLHLILWCLPNHC
jgi:hypothetical protein